MPLRLLLSLQVVVVVVVVVVLLLLGQLLLRLTSPPLPIALQLLLAVVFLRCAKLLLIDLQLDLLLLRAFNILIRVTSVQS
jgi:hypothetical protein